MFDGVGCHPYNGSRLPLRLSYHEIDFCPLLEEAHLAPGLRLGEHASFETSSSMDNMYQKTVLDNGLRVISNFMPHTRSVAICVFVGAGSRYEEDPQAGISHFLEHMLFKGTHQRPSSADISSAIEQVGGMMNGSTDREVTTYWCKVAQPHFYKALDVLIDMVQDPLVEPEEVEKERSVVQEELSMSNDYPTYRAEILKDEMLWPNQPMGRDVGGSKESVQGITRETIVDFFQRQYVSSNVVISIAGNVSHQQVLEAVSPLVKQWPTGAPLAWHPAAYGGQVRPQVRMEYRKTEQAHLYMALPGIATRHPDRYALDMMSTVPGRRHEQSFVPGGAGEARPCLRCPQYGKPLPRYGLLCGLLWR